MNYIGNLKSTQLRKLFKIFNSSLMQSFSIFGARDYPFQNFKFWNEFINWKKIQTGLVPLVSTPAPSDHSPGAIATIAAAVLPAPIVLPCAALPERCYCCAWAQHMSPPRFWFPPRARSSLSGLLSSASYSVPHHRPPPLSHVAVQARGRVCCLPLVAQRCVGARTNGHCSQETDFIGRHIFPKELAVDHHTPSFSE
jgi:hypothetical protein